MWAKVRYAIGVLFGCFLGLGTSVTVHNTSTLSIASTPSPAGIVLGLAVSKAHAQERIRLRKKARRRRARRREEEERKRLEDAQKEPKDTWRATLPAGCVYDSYASATAGAAYICSGIQYQQKERDGVKGYEVIKP